MTAEQLILLKEEAVALKLITQRLEICSLSEKCIVLMKLCYAELLHRVEKLLHLRSKDSI